MTETPEEVPGTGLVPAEPADPELPELVRAAIDAGIPDSTRRAYTAEWRKFLTWCAANGRRALPASGDTLAAYTTYLCYEWVPAKDAWMRRPGDGKPRGMKPASVERARAAIATAHSTAGLDPPPTMAAVKVLAGYRAHLAKSHDPRARQREAPAVTRDDLLQILPPVAGDDPRGLRDRALLLLAYSFAARASDLIALNIEDVQEESRGLIVWAYRSKNRKGEAVAISRQNAPETVTAVTRWLKVLAEAGRTTGPLFIRLRTTRDGKRVTVFGRDPGAKIGDPEGRITEQMVTKTLQKHSKRVGADDGRTGHGLRRGLATTSHRAGNDMFVIARQGGWDKNSRVLARYIEDESMWVRNALDNGAGI